MAAQRFPGLIDIHVHLRDPGATAKEDFTSGTRAALKGGFTFVCDMPNNPSRPTNTQARLEEKILLSRQKSRCDVGFYFGADAANAKEFPKILGNPNVYGLKIYCNHTTGELLVEDVHDLEEIVKRWRSEKPILIHAEGPLIDECLALASRYERRMHICHVSRKRDLVSIRRAKTKGVHVSTGVTPHHLFLTHHHIAQLGALALVKPEIGSNTDQEALWEGLMDGTIDLVESDHAPHRKEEKTRIAPPYGVPGLETTLGLLLGAVHEHRLTMEQVITLLYEHPKRLFSIPTQAHTYIELDPQKPYRLGAEGYETKCGWSPFDGWEVFGKVMTVVLRNTVLVRDGKVV